MLRDNRLRKVNHNQGLPRRSGSLSRIGWFESVRRRWPDGSGRGLTIPYLCYFRPHQLAASPGRKVPQSFHHITRAHVVPRPRSAPLLVATYFSPDLRVNSGAVAMETTRHSSHVLLEFKPDEGTCQHPREDAAGQSPFVSEDGNRQDQENPDYILQVASPCVDGHCARGPAPTRLPRPGTVNSSQPLGASLFHLQRPTFCSALV